MLKPAIQPLSSFLLSNHQIIFISNFNYTITHPLQSPKRPILSTPKPPQTTEGKPQTPPFSHQKTISAFLLNLKFRTTHSSPQLFRYQSKPQFAISHFGPISRFLHTHIGNFVGSSRKPDTEMNSCSSPSGSGAISVFSTFTSLYAKSIDIDASSSLRKPLSLWPGMYHSPVTNALWEARSSIFERLLDPVKDGAPPQSELLAKTPSQSRTSIIYKFSGDFILREQYRDAWNEVRIGKLLEDLDALAGTIAVKHCSNDDNTTRPLLLVTASVDKIALKKPLRVDADLKVAGAVTWVGRSSIEIQMEVTQADKENAVSSDPIALTANFMFVARDSKTGKSAPVNRLSPESEKEKKLLHDGEMRDKLRKRHREEKQHEFEKGHSLHGEVSRLKALLTEGRILCDMPALADRDSILIRDTRLENALICQPQQRNLHGRIFGGFLMHRAFELAFSTAYAFIGRVPYFLEVDHVDFLRPVDVGDFLRFKSCVLYTQLENPMQPLINIEVEAHVTRPELRTSEVSNTFYFTFTVKPDTLKEGRRIRNVVPATEEEARRVLERMDAEKEFLTNS